MNNVEVHKLSGVELAHTFLVGRRVVTLGNPKGPFAFYQDGTNSLCVLGANDENVVQVSFDTDLACIPLKLAQKQEASFSVENGVVICRMGRIEARGETYSEAAMRALVLSDGAVKPPLA